MPVSDSFRTYVLEQLKRSGSITDRRMFGGVGLYADGIFFAIIHHDTLYFKVDDSTRSDYVNEGMDPFRPYGEEGRSMSYYQVPAHILEHADRLGVWMTRAVEAAQRSERNTRKRRSET